MGQTVLAKHNSGVMANKKETCGETISTTKKHSTGVNYEHFKDNKKEPSFEDQNLYQPPPCTLTISFNGIAWALFLVAFGLRWHNIDHPHAVV